MNLDTPSITHQLALVYETNKQAEPYAIYELDWVSNQQMMKFVSRFETFDLAMAQLSWLSGSQKITLAVTPVL